MFGLRFVSILATILNFAGFFYLDRLIGIVLKVFLADILN